MKVMILIFLLIAHHSLEASCLLGTYNLQKEKENSVNLSHLKDVALEFQQLMRNKLPPEKTLIIHFQMLTDQINAEVVKLDDQVKIEVMGGMLKHSLMNAETLRLLLCHEIGHFLGGSPFKARGGWSSTEGQADYYSSSDCVRSFHFDEEIFMNAAQNLTAIYAEVRGANPPKIDRCDPHIAERTNYGYPSIQCRLDTLVSGWYGLQRPKCWFRD